MQDYLKAYVLNVNEDKEKYECVWVDAKAIRLIWPIVVRTKLDIAKIVEKYCETKKSD